MRAKNSVIGVYKSESLKPVIDADHMPFHQIIRKLGLGVKYVSVPNRSTRSPERRQWEKQRWFKQGQKWRTGCEGRISVLKRRHGIARCRYHGFDGMRRWVGLGVIADNVVNLGRWLVAQPA